MKGATQCELRGQLVEIEVEGRGIKESIPQLMTSELFWAWTGLSQEKRGVNTLEGVQTIGKGSVFAFASSQILHCWVTWLFSADGS